MTIIQAILLGIIQGITEFLPISSSGHLILFQNILNLPSENLMVFDIAVHVATLLAIVIYFWHDIIDILTNLRSQYKKVLALVVASLPIVFIGMLFGSELNAIFRDPVPVAIMLGLTAVLFWFAETYKGKAQGEHKHNNFGTMKWPAWLLIGILQAVAIIPGVSRAGSTISGGLLTGLQREEAAKFSFLLGIIAIGGAGGITVLEFIETPTLAAEITWSALTVGFIAAFIAGYISVSLLMKLLKKHSLKGFSVYLLVLSVGTLVVSSLTG